MCFICQIGLKKSKIKASSTKVFFLLLSISFAPILSLGFSLQGAARFLISIIDFYIATLMVIVIQSNIMMILYAAIFLIVILAEVIKAILTFFGLEFFMSLV